MPTFIGVPKKGRNSLSYHIHPFSSECLMLRFGNITDADGVEGVKRSVAMLPSTFAALEGADRRLWRGRILCVCPRQDPRGLRCAGFVLFRRRSF